MQSTWKKWLQGSTRSSSPPSKGLMHTAHTSSDAASPAAAPLDGGDAPCLRVASAASTSGAVPRASLGTTPRRRYNLSEISVS